MLQRAKIADAAHLTVVQAGEADAPETKPAPSTTDPVEGRGPSPQQADAATKKTPAAGTRKANRKLVLAGAAVAVPILIHLLFRQRDSVMRGIGVDHLQIFVLAAIVEAEPQPEAIR